MNTDPGRMNPLTLHFADPALEQAFREERARKMLKPIRVTVLLVVVLAGLFWLLLPRFLREFRDARSQFAWPLVALVASMLWLYVRSHLPSFLRRQQFIMMVGCVLLTVGTTALASALPLTALGTFGLSVLLMHTLNIYNIFRLRFPLACLAGWNSALVHLSYFTHTGALAWPVLGHQGGRCWPRIFLA